MRQTRFAAAFGLCLVLTATARSAESQVTDAAVVPRRIAPGAAFKVTAAVRDDDTLMGGFILNLRSEEIGLSKDIEYLFGHLARQQDGRIELIVGPGNNSRYGDADITGEWTVGAKVRVRLLVRDINDQRTTVELGEVTVVAEAPKVAAAEPEPHADARLAPGEGWRADFDDGTLSGAGEPHYVVRGEGRVDDGRLVFEIKDGIVTVGARFDESSARGAADYVPLAWRGLNVSLTDYPIIELRFRPSDEKAGVLVQTTLEFANRSRQSPYFYATFDTAGEWNAQAHRLAGDASLPKPWTPRKLVDLNIWILSDRPVTVDFDWVRLRAVNEQERAREDEWVELVKGYDPGEPEVLREFFPFGVYAGPPDTSSAHQYFHRQTFAILARHHLNFFLAGAPQRTRGRWLPDTADRAMPIVAAARDTGIRVCLRMRRGTAMFAEHGSEAIADWARPIIEAARDCPEVIGYDVGDERPLAALYDLVAAVAVLKRLDPTRPSVQTFWDYTSVLAYDPYLPLNGTDIYPLRENNDQTAAYMTEWCRKVAQATGNKRQWIILQSFGCAPWRQKRGYIVPTPEELSLMSWASLAGGARGLIYYSFSYDRYKMLADQWGNPNELLREIARLGEHLIPLGHRLLDCVVDFDTDIACANSKMIVGVLHAPERGVRYVIVANSDVRLPQEGTLTGLDGTLFDLAALEPAADGRIRVLPPGGGRAYLLGTPEQFGAEAEAVRANRDAEQQRVQTPDRTLKRLYGDRLDAALAARARLDEIGRLMGSVEPAMFDDNPDPVVVERVAPFRESYWKLHTPWARAYDDLLAGKGAGDQLDTLIGEARAVATEIRAALDGRPMYPGERRH